MTGSSSRAGRLGRYRKLQSGQHLAGLFQASSSGGRTSESLSRRGRRRNEHKASKPVVPAELFWLVPQDHQHCRGSPHMVKRNTGVRPVCPLNPYLLSNKAKPCKVIASWLFPPCFLTSAGVRSCTFCPLDSWLQWGVQFWEDKELPGI